MNEFDLMDAFAMAPPNCVQHFRPNVLFMDWWLNYTANRLVIEVGAGMCRFTKTMHEFGIKALAIESRATDEVRIECASFLLPLCVQRAQILGETPTLVVAARPDHSGWFSELPSLIHPDSELLYIGLPSNFKQDLEGMEFETLYMGAGEDDEHFLRITT